MGLPKVFLNYNNQGRTADNNIFNQQKKEGGNI